MNKALASPTLDSMATRLAALPGLRINGPITARASRSTARTAASDSRPVFAACWVTIAHAEPIGPDQSRAKRGASYRRIIDIGSGG